MSGPATSEANVQNKDAKGFLHRKTSNVSAKILTMEKNRDVNLSLAH